MPATLLHSLSVLVLEDDYYLAEDAKEVLESAGANVLGPFGKSSIALEEARKTPPDCALVDLNLGSGPDFAAAEQFLKMGIGVVLVTGYDSSIIPQALSHLSCLQKPTQAQRIVTAVARACGR